MLFARYDGPTLLNKASDQEKQAADQNQAFTTGLQNQYNTEFANSQQIQGSLNQQLQNITNRGMAGQGFQPGEEAALRTNAAEGSAQAQTGAQAAMAQQLGARSEGGALNSGALAQVVGQNASNQAAQLAGANRGITMQNAALARDNMSMGLSGQQGLAGQMASQANGVGGNAVQNGSNSFNEVTQAHQPSNFWGNLAAGAAGGVVNAFAPGVGTMLSSGLKSAINGPSQGGDDEDFLGGL